MANPLFTKVHQHILDADVILATEDRRPSLARDFRIAKLVLQETSQDTGDSLYDHLVDIIKKTLDERPPNVADYFEDFSRQIKEHRYKSSETYLHHTYIEPERLLTAKHLLKMFISLPTSFDIAPPEPEEVNNDDEEPQRLPLVTDAMQLNFYWSLAGIGFPPDKIYLLSCCIWRLKQKPIVKRCRFWGQIFGIHTNYFIVEADLTETEIEKRRTIAVSLTAQPTVDVELLEEIPSKLVAKRPPRDDDTFEQPPMPINKYVPDRTVPAESCGTGCNRKTYFVCNQLGEDWTELPTVTCAQIVAARKLRKFFTGNLKAKLTSTYPVFEGREDHFLRATIARISAATYVAPIGFYATDDDGESDDVGSDDEEAVNNDKETEPSDEYEPLRMEALLLSSNWVHYRPHVLSQGRVNWFDVKTLEEVKDEASKESDDDDDDDDEKEEEKEIPPEIGPALLAPCSEDTTIENVIPWTVRVAYQSPQPNGCALVVMQSNIWHGAVSLAMASQRVHDSLYVGWGQKFVTRNYSPQPLPEMKKDWLDEESLVEIVDPTVEEEEAWELENNKKEEEEIEAESNEEDDENDDDDDSV